MGGRCSWNLVNKFKHIAKYPTMHKRASTAKIYPGQNVSGAVVEEPCFKGKSLG